jgi:hypothetical protein
MTSDSARVVFAQAALETGALTVVSTAYDPECSKKGGEKDRECQQDQP